MVVCVGRWRVGGGERNGEDGIKTVENGVRKREKGRERVKGK